MYFLFKQRAEFDWDKRTQSLILSGFFYGYICVQVIGGWAAGRFGGKIVIGVFMGVASGVTLLIPVLARLSPYGVFVARIVIGMSSVSFLYICLFNLFTILKVFIYLDTCSK